MKSDRIRICSLAMLIAIYFSISLISAYEADPLEYTNEFTVQDESCVVDDAFFYTTSQNQLSLNSVYNCCNKNGNCILLVFDLKNRKSFEVEDTKEIFHVKSIRDAIKRGEINPESYNPDSVDVCSYFSSETKQQSVNLAFDAGEGAVKYAPKNSKEIFYIIKNSGKAAGLISEFNLGLFIVGITCNGLSNQEKEAFLKVGECYQLIGGIKSGTAHYGISSQVVDCNKEAKIKLRIVFSLKFVY